jgi:hypothetical protein
MNKLDAETENTNEIINSDLTPPEDDLVPEEIQLPVLSRNKETDSTETQIKPNRLKLFGTENTNILTTIFH